MIAWLRVGAIACGCVVRTGVMFETSGLCQTVFIFFSLHAFNPPRPQPEERSHGEA